MSPKREATEDFKDPLLNEDTQALTAGKKDTKRVLYKHSVVMPHIYHESKGNNLMPISIDQKV